MSSKERNLPVDVVKKIFLFSDDPSKLSLVNKQFNSVSRIPTLRLQWLLSRAQVLQKWAKIRIDSRTVTEKEYLEMKEWISKEDSKFLFPERLLTDEVNMGIMKSLIEISNRRDQKSRFDGFGIVWNDATISEVFLALWSHCCWWSQLGLARWILSEKPSHIYKLLDRVAWREATYIAIMSSPDSEFTSEPNIFQQIIRDRPDLFDYVPGAPILASQLGHLEVIKELLELKGYSKGIDILLESVRLATSAGHSQIVNLLCQLISIANKDEVERNKLAKHFEDMTSLQDAANRSNWVEVENIMNKWKVGDAEMFKIHWFTAVEFGCHNGLVEFVRRLILFGKAASFRPTVRMLALAIGNNEVMRTIIESIPRYETELVANEKKLSLLRDLPVNEVEAYEQLLIRYCTETDPQIALELADDTSQSVTGLAGAAHRKDMVEFLVDSGKIKRSSKPVQEAMWSVVVSGRMDIAKILRDSGISLGWMEPSREKLDETQDINEISKKEASFAPPSTTTVLMSALGGDWSNMARGLSAGSGNDLFKSLEDIENFLVAEIAAANSIEDRGMTKYRERVRTGSFASSFIKPRMLVDPNDNFWTAFLSGNTQEMNKLLNSKVTLGWMEPATAPKHRKISYDVSKKSETNLDEEMDYDSDEEKKTTWAGVLGLKDPIKDEQMDVDSIGMFLGLGGTLPEK
ncbi:hypothetical protein HK096_011448 [Nowakowskiella sp. JEL0078]|nr:hypothetical protein HK096_011448 [Nowakowskiella sp. JEL0078]